MQHNGLSVNTQMYEPNLLGCLMDAKAFGQRVLRARLELGALATPVRQVTQSEIGAALGVTGVTVGRWEAGAKEPDLDTITRLARVLRVRAAWLAFGDGPMREAGENGDRISVEHVTDASQYTRDAAVQPRHRPAKKKRPRAG